jgi:predicted small lipoprotein YifL
MRCWPHYLFILVVISLGMLSLSSACGRKGPLYLPEESAKEPSAAQSDVPRTTAPASDPGPVRP